MEGESVFKTYSFSFFLSFLDSFQLLIRISTMAAKECRTRGRSYSVSREMPFFLTKIGRVRDIAHCYTLHDLLKSYH